MKLAFATNASPYGAASFGGAETSCRLLAEKLAARGHRILYLARGIDAAQIEEAAARGVDLRALPEGRSSRRWRLEAMLSLALLFRRERVDVFYCFYEVDLLRVALSARRLARRPRIVMQMAGLHWYETCLRNPRKTRLYARLFSGIDAVNFVEERLVEVTDAKLRELGLGDPFRHRFVAEIGSGVAAHRERPYGDLPAAPFRLVMAARFASYSRRQDILVEAMALIPEEREVELLLVGEGTKRAEVEQLAKRRGLGDRVRFLPFMPQPELWALLSGAHLLTHCAEHEGLGKAIVESMALGLPVLASDVRVISDYIRDGANGFLVENTPAAWAARIVELMDDPGRRDRVSEAGLDFVRRNHDPERNVLKYEAEFAALGER